MRPTAAAAQASTDSALNLTPPGYNCLMSTVPQSMVPSRWVAPLLALVAALLVPWTLVLAYRLPSRHTSHHWDIAWVGFDIALAGALAATGWAIARRAAWAPSAAAAAATLLLCDAWFDNVLAAGSRSTSRLRSRRRSSRCRWRCCACGSPATASGR